MKNKTNYLLLFVFAFFISSCSSDDDSEVTSENAKDVTDCELTITPDTIVQICVDGADFALPNETIKFATSFYTRDNDSSDTEFMWTIESGNLEILNIENSINGRIAKSIATIQFNSDYSGNGLIKGAAENNNTRASLTHIVELETD